MSKTKKLDIFNLFYSGAAVVILIGVIAKLLEWPSQDLLITVGLAIEAVVFGVSAFKFVEVNKESELATEATLSKVAEGIGDISSNSGTMGGAGDRDTYVNFQTGTVENPHEIVTPSTSVSNFHDKKIPIEINSPTNTMINTRSHTLWQQEQIDMLRLEQLIQKVDYTDYKQLSSLINLLQSQSDELKSRLWSRFKKIKYNFITNSGYSFLKLLVQSTISFHNASYGAKIFNYLIEFQTTESKFIVLNDVINYSAETIYFGPRNEYSIHLNELFLNGELENLSYINSIIDQLVSDNVAPKYMLLQLFGLSDSNSKKEVYDKLNYRFSKTNTKPNREQLLFILLYEQYSNF